MEPRIKRIKNTVTADERRWTQIEKDNHEKINHKGHKVKQKAQETQEIEQGLKENQRDKNRTQIDAEFQCKRKPRIKRMARIKTGCRV
ncbi:hypothetical protein KAW65_01280 [candidate division WOR-3 bacterium]|nr:hypothetical protein [candidate division WOR-3 bacterium]